MLLFSVDANVVIVVVGGIVVAVFGVDVFVDAVFVVIGVGVAVVVYVVLLLLLLLL